MKPGMTSAEIDIKQAVVEVPFPAKGSIHCVRSSTTEQSKQGPSLVFTHGAGGTLKADAVVNFANGFAAQKPIMCFQGTMNLKSRVTMFETVCEHQKAFKCLGGRSMGARAAVMAATSETTHLVLVSYPLHTAKDVRDKILLDLPESMKVLFISGDNDSMCDLDRLESVLQKMPCTSWLCTVKGADHGMKAKGKQATTEMGRKTGEVAALWLDDSSQLGTAVSLSLDAETQEIVLQEADSPSSTPAQERKRKQSIDEPQDAPSTEKRTTSGRKRRR